VAASVGVETVVPGEVVESTNGLATVRVGTSLVHVAQAAVPFQSVFVCIRAEDVTLETSERGDVSARNQWPGRVTAIQPEAGVVRVTMECGFSLRGLTPRPACDRLGVEEDSAVTAVVKATAVHLIPRDTPA